MPQHEPDDLAAELVPDPAQLPDVVVLRGYLGESARTGVSRLYVNLNFSEFVEVADEDVVAKRSIDADPLGGAVVWVKRNATLLRATVSSAEEQATFLTGEITANALRRSRMVLPAGQGLVMARVQNQGPTDPLFYSSCRTCGGPRCGDPVDPLPHTPGHADCI